MLSSSFRFREAGCYHVTLIDIVLSLHYVLS